VLIQVLMPFYYKFLKPYCYKCKGNIFFLIKKIFPQKKAELLIPLLIQTQRFTSHT